MDLTLWTDEDKISIIGSAVIVERLTQYQISIKNIVTNS